MTHETVTPEVQAYEDRRESIRMIRDSAAAVVPRDLGRVRALRFRRPGFDTAVLATMGGMGWIGLRLPEAMGGIGLGACEEVALLEELGRGLVPEPLVAATLSAALLAAAAPDHPLLPRLLAGEAYAATAWQDTAGSLEVADERTGVRRFIPAAAGASHLLVPVRDGNRLGLFLRLSASADLALIETQDGGHWGEWAVDLAGVELLCADIGTALAARLDGAALATAAYLLGLSERCFALTLDYMRTRQQFGRFLGSFQALQHRLADLKIQIALSRASVESAAAEIDAGASPQRAARVASRAKARLSRAVLLVTREAVQLHGAIGYTDEHDIGLFLRKAMTMAGQFGSATAHRARFATLSDLGSPRAVV